MRNIVLITLFVLLNHLLLSQSIDYKPFPEWAWGKEDSTEYYLYTPPNLEPGKKYPIALFMHGCCGEDLIASPRNAVDPPARMWHNFGANEQQIPTYIISAKTDRGWSKHFENLKDVIDFLIEKRQGDPQRIYVTGFSMGGLGTFQFISEYPNYFAAALPMGMSFFNGDFDKIKHIPIWTNQGSTDWWSREQYKFVKETRSLNGLALDSAWEWVTGVNPLYTSFKGVGHGVQWHATSTQDLIGWAYSKINDGNQYPQVYFVSPQYRQQGIASKSFKLEINANDPDGSIAKIDLFVNKKFHSTLNKAPYVTKIKPDLGDNVIEAVAFDDKGKSNTVTTTLVVNNKPVLSVNELPYGRLGAHYAYWLPAIGNGTLKYTSKSLPDGLTLLEDGLIRGIPMAPGQFKIEMSIEDIDGDITNTTLNLEIKALRQGEVLVTNAKDKNDLALPVSKTIYNEVPNFERDAAPSSFIEEINFSNLNDFYNLTYIKSEGSDSTLASDEYMHFEVDQNVEVLIGYEKLDYLASSTIPDWLKEYKKYQKTEIVAQYRYYDIYSKSFPKGKVVLPGADKKNNGIGTNYFVIVRTPDLDVHPEINISQLPTASLNTYYLGTLSALYGYGKLTWEMIDGKLPEGITLNAKGWLEGRPTTTGSFTMVVRVTDEKDQQTSATVKLDIR